MMPELRNITPESINRWRLPLQTALLNLVVVALLGLLLRYTFVTPLAGINYKNVLHAHSHVALLGWLYPAFFIALLWAYLPPALHGKSTYTWQFWLSQGAVLGMLLSFPVQGYGPVSITFSTAHLLFTYWFAYSFLKDAGTAEVNTGKHAFSFRFVKAALFFLVLSSLGPWGMGPIMAAGQTGTELYYNAIYFYLHFLYNGWLTFAVLALLFWLLEKYKINFHSTYSLWFFRLMFWACLAGYLLSVLWVKPDTIVYLIAGAAAFVQVIALALLYLTVRPERQRIFGLVGSWAKGLFILAATAFILKTIMQFASAFPYVANLAYQLRGFIIGYLHLVLIGFVSFFILYFFAQQGWFSFRSRLSRWGMGIFILGFISSEALLFLQGFFYWAGLGEITRYHTYLFYLSILLPTGAVLIFISQIWSAKSRQADVESKTGMVLKKV